MKELILPLFVFEYENLNQFIQSQQNFISFTYVSMWLFNWISFLISKIIPNPIQFHPIPLIDSLTHSLPVWLPALE